MPINILKNYRKVHASDSSNALTNLESRVTILENNEYKITYYEVVSGTSGTLTPPTNSTINSGEFGLSGNAILSKIDGSNKVTFESPKTAGGVIVTTSLNTSTGAWVASGTYTDTSVAVIYSIKIKGIDFHYLNLDRVIETAEIEEKVSFQAPLVYDFTTNKASIPKATTSVDGYLSSTDWTTFNNKQPAGNYITALTGDVTASGPGSVSATLASVITAATKGASDKSLTLTYDVKGRLISVSENNIQIAESQVTGLPEDIKFIYDESSTGLISFGGLSIGSPTTTFSVGAVSGYFIDAHTDPLNPTKTFVSFSAQNNISVTNIATQDVTYIGINSSGVIQQSTNPFTAAQQRTIIRLGVIVHSNRVVVNAINNQPNSILNIGGQLNDLIEALGVFNLSGNIISVNGANLNINKSSGVLFKAGINFNNDNKNPHELTLAALTAPTNIRYRLRDDTEYSNTAVIDPNNYDNGGVLTAVPDTKYTIQYIYLFQSNLLRIQYGQSYYDSLDDARAAINNTSFSVAQNLSQNGLMICALVVRKGCTDLTNTLQAKFTPIERFGRPSETNTGTGLFRKQILNNASSGLMTGGNITIDTGTTVNIVAGRGLVIDNTTDPTNPVLIEVSWNAFTGQAITNVATQMGTALYINSDGTLFQDNITNVPNGTYSRSKIFIGAVGHPAGTLTNVYAVPDAIINPISGMNDFAKAIGPFPISGNKISKNLGALTLSKSVGSSFFLNSNYQTDKTNPNTLTCASLAAPTLQYVKQNAFLGPVSSSISTTQYDNAGTLTTIPNNHYVTHRIWHQPSNNILFFQYSQYQYVSFDDAKIGLNNEDFIVPTPLSYGAYVVAVIITRESETNLDNTARSLIIPQNKFSGTGSGGGGTTAPVRTNGGNTAYSITKDDQIIYTGTALTAPRTWTLPDATTVTAGKEFIIDDELQTVTSTNTLTIAVQTGQKLNGTTNGTEIINSAGGWRRLISNGVDGWFFDAGIGRLGKTQTWIGVNTFSQAPIVPTQAANDNSTKAASTAYADAIAALKANLASPTFTGTPAAPTATSGTSTTQLATTAFVQEAVTFMLPLTSANFGAPADATTYYWDANSALAMTTTSTGRGLYIPRNCTLIEVSIASNSTASTSNENCTLGIRLNDTTNTSYTTTTPLTGTAIIARITGLSTNYTAGDFILPYITTPTWGTNPANWRLSVVLTFKLR